MIKKIQGLLNKLGLDLLRYPNHLLKRRIDLIGLNEIDLILDIGANDGSYGKQMIKIGYSGKIFSVEPLSHTYEKLLKGAKKNKKWKTFHAAIGDHDGEIDINISENTYSSSILEMEVI